jgi:hypothetical protein
VILLPQLNPDLLDYLLTEVPPEAPVFEWGSGGSTVWFAKHFCSIVSVENCPSWMGCVEAALKREKLSNWKLVLRPPEVVGTTGDPSELDGYRSDVEEFSKCTFQSYAREIDGYSFGFGLILVDGRARPSCVMHALPRLAPGGVIVLDDSYRDRYQKAVKVLDQFPCKTFNGIAPGADKAVESKVWRKP